MPCTELQAKWLTTYLLVWRNPIEDWRIKGIFPLCDQRPCCTSEVYALSVHFENIALPVLTDTGSKGKGKRWDQLFGKGLSRCEEYLLHMHYCNVVAFAYCITLFNSGIFHWPASSVQVDSGEKQTNGFGWPWSETARMTAWTMAISHCQFLRNCVPPRGDRD